MSYKDWPKIISPPQDGELVDHSTTARAHKALADRTEYLRQSLNDYSTKNGRVTLQDVQLSPDIELGDIVYYDTLNKSYGRALAEGEVDLSTGALVATPRAFAVGICVRREIGSNYGNILISGNSDLNSDFGISPSSLFDRASEFSSTGSRGYLSSLTPGKITSRPVSPLVQIGMFYDEISFISPLQKDIFESHVHYRFDISSLPSSGLKISNNDNMLYINYQDAYTTIKQSETRLRISIKKNSDVTTISSLDSIIVSLTNVTVLGVHKLHYSFGSTVGDIDWPQYGEYVSIPGTGLSVSFYKADIADSNTLIEDIQVTFSGLAGVNFEIKCPLDISGWTNANPMDPNTPSGAKYRLIHEENNSLQSVWPPTPLESAIIETNGINRIKNVEFIANQHGIYWMSDCPPWAWPGVFTPYNQNLRNKDNIAIMDDEGEEHSITDYTKIYTSNRNVLFFSKTTLENSRSVVLSLDSNSPMISVVDCFTNLKSTTGHLKLNLDLQLNENVSVVPDYIGLSGIDPTTSNFKRSTIVSELNAGTGIRIIKEKETSGINTNCGILTISRSDTKFEGIVEVVSLVNAKEDIIDDLFPVIYFPAPSTGKYKMVSRVKIPNEDIQSGRSISVVLVPSLFGSESVGNSNATSATFSTKSYIIKNGSVLSSSSQILDSTIYIPYVAPYQRLTVFTPVTINIPSQGVVAGSQIYTSWERITSGDTYTGSVGFSQIHWKINIT